MHRFLTLLLFGFLFLLFNASTLFAQTSIPRHSVAPDKKGAEFAIDLSGVALGLTLASRRQDHTRFGVTVTFGAELTNFVVGSKFFSSYSIKAKEWNARTIHLLAIQVFGRKQKWEHFENEFGFRFSYYYHEDRIRNDSERREWGKFFGLYMHPMWGKGFFKIGTRMSIGAYNGYGAGLELTPMFRITF